MLTTLKGAVEADLLQHVAPEDDGGGEDEENG